MTCATTNLHGRTELVAQFQVSLTWLDFKKQAWSTQKSPAQVDTIPLTTRRQCTFERQNRANKNSTGMRSCRVTSLACRRFDFAK